MSTAICLHGMSGPFMLDRDPKFFSSLWKHLIKLPGTRPNMPTSFHSQTDKSSKIANRVLEKYLRSYFSQRRSSWDLFFNKVEFPYNSDKIKAMKISIFELE